MNRSNRKRGRVESASDISASVCRRIRQMRSDLGWSLEQLSAASGVSRSMLSQIENSKVNPTLAVMHRIAQALGMPLGELVETASGAPRIDIIRAGDTQYLYRSDKDCRIRTLFPLHLEKDVEFYQVCLSPDGELRSAPHFEGTREYLTVEKGTIRIESGRAEATLSRGDSASYRADAPHAIANIGRGEAWMFLVVIYK